MQILFENVIAARAQLAFLAERDDFSRVIHNFQLDMVQRSFEQTTSFYFGCHGGDGAHLGRPVSRL